MTSLREAAPTSPLGSMAFCECCASSQEACMLLALRLHVVPRPGEVLHVMATDAAFF